MGVLAVAACAGLAGPGAAYSEIPYFAAWCYTTPPQSPPQFSVIVQDASGNLILGGPTSMFPGMGSGAVTKLTRDGALIWAKTFPEPSSVSALATDSAGNIYAAGSSTPGGATLPWINVKKLDSNGVEQWSLTVAGSNSVSGDNANAVATDGTAVYVGGCGYWSGPASKNYFLGIYDAATGALSCSVTGSEFGPIRGLALDGGNLYAIATGANQFGVGVRKSTATSVAQTATSYLGAIGANAASRFPVFVSGGYLCSGWAGMGGPGTYTFYEIDLGTLAVHHSAWLADGGGDIGILPNGMIVSLGTGLNAYERTTAGANKVWQQTSFTQQTVRMPCSSITPGALTAGSDGRIYTAGNGGAIAFGDPVAKKAVPTGTIEIRNNVIALDGDAQKLGGHSGVAYIFAKGGVANRVVRLAVYGPSGKFLGQLPELSLNASGSGYASFAGIVEGKRLPTGMYYIVADAAIKDRKPIMILGTKGQ